MVARGALKALSGLAVRPRIVSLTAVHVALAALGSAASESAAQVHVTSQDAGPVATVDFRTSVDAHQRQRIEASLARHHQNWASAARELGMHRANLIRLARRLGLRRE